MEELAIWRNIAIVVLGLQCMLLLVIALAAGYALVRVTALLHDKSEGAAHKVQQVTRTVAQRTEQVADKAVQPVLAVKGRAARIQGALRSLGVRGFRSSGSTLRSPDQ